MVDILLTVLGRLFRAGCGDCRLDPESQRSDLGVGDSGRGALLGRWADGADALMLPGQGSVGNGGSEDRSLKELTIVPSNGWALISRIEIEFIGITNRWLGQPWRGGGALRVGSEVWPRALLGSIVGRHARGSSQGAHGDGWEVNDKLM